MKTFRVLINRIAANGEVFEVNRHAIRSMSLALAKATAWGIAAKIPGKAFVASVEPCSDVMLGLQADNPFAFAPLAPITVQEAMAMEGVAA